ncbi:MAG: hypothetical protein AAF633_21595 [Chloroflexota bacterium]
MDIDILKSEWDKQSQYQEKSPSQISAMIASSVDHHRLKQRSRYFRLLLFAIVMPILATGLFYSMSDGFTDSNDPISTLWIVLVIFIPLQIFFWLRYRATQAPNPANDRPILTNLTRSINLMRQNQRQEVGLMAIILALSLSGTAVSIFQGSTIPPLILGVTSVWALFLAINAWRRYQNEVAELNRFQNQLKVGMGPADMDLI